MSQVKMRHHNKNKKFGRPRNQRIALFRALCLSLIEKGKIKTTLAKAKEIRSIVEKMITIAKSASLSSSRLLASRLYNNKKAVSKLIKDLAPKYIDRKGGYTRIIKLGQRKSDSAKMAIIEFV